MKKVEFVLAMASLFIAINCLTQIDLVVVDKLAYILLSSFVGLIGVVLLIELKPTK